jgi:4,5:9,10-diseco-3-hydroxy-5,9,17-trioxoandrosta-1(10),2-diene-4-oate hydrolase
MMLDVEGTRLWVDRIGRGEAVLCLHATGHDSRDFDALIARQGQQFEFIRIEWPGHARSGADHMPASAARYAQLAAAVLDQLHIDAPIILGNSVGAAAAILVAVHRPIRALVLCDSGGLLEVTPTVARFCRVFERFFAAGERGVFWFQAAFRLYYRWVLPSAAAREQRLRIIGNARRHAAVMREAWASFGDPSADIRAPAAALRIPIWVAWARQDRVIPLKRCLPAIEQLKYATLTEFDGGHSAFLEQPDLFASCFEQFVRGVEVRPGTARSSLR